jgi:hypothetical protein
MSDRYDKVGEGANAEFRAKQAKIMGLGFDLPKQLKAEVLKKRKRESVQQTYNKTAK